MRVLALDFDGVVCDSSREVFTVAVRTYAQLNPGSPWIRAILDQPGRDATECLDLSAEPAFAALQRLIPLGNRAEDFGVALRALELGVELPDQAAYDAFYHSLDAGWLGAYHATFYEIRDRLRTREPSRWLALNDGYPPFTAFLTRAAGRCAIAILTARDGASLDVLLDHLGVSAIIPRQLRLDKQAGLHKTSHLSQLADRLQVSFPEITFVDDKVNHLERVAPLGVRPVLAGWGLNTPREHARATALGIAVARLDALDSVLLDG
jgi:phosphoglycolate phosphatase-like HAD superfamily hydrolase